MKSKTRFESASIRKTHISMRRVRVSNKKGSFLKQNQSQFWPSFRRRKKQVEEEDGLDKEEDDHALRRNGGGHREVGHVAELGTFGIFLFFHQKKNNFFAFFIKLIWLGGGFLNRTGAEIGY